MNLHTLNPWAILVAAFSAFLLGGLWYSPILFHSAWKKANHFGDNEPPAAGRKGLQYRLRTELSHGFQSGDVPQ